VSTDPLTWGRIAALLPAPLTVIDIGARGGIDVDWAPFSPHVVVYAFEPDQEECARLNRDEGKIAEYIPIAVASTAGELPFYVTRDPFCSSLLVPIGQLTEERPRLAGMRIRHTATITTDTLDHWRRERRVDHLDYLKLDVQGAELAILEGAASSLDSVRAVKLEVQFNRLYQGAPLFGQIDHYLRERNFVLWRLSELSHCGFADVSATCDVPEIVDYDSRRVELLGGGGQLLWANAFYVRRETAELSLQITWHDALRDACIAYAHSYSDLAEICLQRSLETAPSEAHAAIREAVSLCSEGA
jgi:FkbM family methyltransferase